MLAPNSTWFDSIFMSDFDINFVFSTDWCVGARQRDFPRIWVSWPLCGRPRGSILSSSLFTTTMATSSWLLPSVKRSFSTTSKVNFPEVRPFKPNSKWQSTMESQYCLTVDSIYWDIKLFQTPHPSLSAFVLGVLRILFNVTGIQMGSDWNFTWFLRFLSIPGHP